MSSSGQQQGEGFQYESLALSRPLVVVILPHATTRFRPEDGSAEAVKKSLDARKIFERIIKAINDKDKDHPQLKFAEDDWKPAGYSLLSEDPFRFYQTYIHKSCITQYMQQLASEGGGHLDPIRALPNPAKFEADMATYIEQAKAAGGTDENKKKPTSASNGDVKKAAQTAKDEKEQGTKLVDSTLTYNKDALPETWTTVLTTLLGLTMIQGDGTAGTGASPKPPDDIMGVSASDIAANVLKWTSQPKPADPKGNNPGASNDRPIAEWLHLWAYSSGEADDSKETTENLNKSSEIRGNLVFGTSEANSCMTRYQKAWQQLIKDEKLFRENGVMLQGEPLNGELIVIRNDPTHGVIEDTEVPTDPDPKATEKAEPAKEYTWKKTPPIKQTDPLAQLAAKFKFLAYNIRYEIHLQGSSAVLSKSFSSKSLLPSSPTLTSKVWFHPFSRRFHHLAEHDLDAALYQHMFITSARATLPKLKADKIIKERFKDQKYIFEGDKSAPKDAEAMKKLAMTFREQREAMFDKTFGFDPKDPLRNPSITDGDRERGASKPAGGRMSWLCRSCLNKAQGEFAHLLR